MKWKAVALSVLALWLCVAQTPYAGAQPPPPRLLVDNRTPYPVDVYVWNGATWNFVKRLAPSTWEAFPNVDNGSFWRAVFGQVVREHKVQYQYDPGYGGYQDVWWVQ